MTEDELKKTMCPHFDNRETLDVHGQWSTCIGSPCSQFRVNKWTIRDHLKSEAAGDTVLTVVETAWCGLAGKP